ncbi:MAG: ACT domain-containing protein [Ruminococcus sp.]|nr:ACT domain-containing protein [Ruminococcus sp.]
MYLIKQISIFVENKPGRLKAMTNILKENNIDIRALSIADTKDFGILRLIVNDPDKTCEVLKNAECTVTITEVLAVGLEDKPGGLSVVMDTLFENSISVEYMYAFFSKLEGQASVILRVNDNKMAADVLKNANIKLLTSEEIYNM